MSLKHPGTAGLASSRELLSRNTELLLGPAVAERSVRIVARPATFRPLRTLKLA